MSEKNLTPWEVLRYKFPANEYVLIQEVSDASGFSRTRSLDYMLINLWQSRGLAVTGIEQKSWRGDWLKELKNPKKQENHFKHCDYFYLLTTSENIAKLEEIPLTWGWWHINEKGILKTMKPAPKLESEPIGRSLMCAMLRRAAEKVNHVHVDSIQDAIKIAVSNSRDHNERALKDLKEQYDIYKNQVIAFEKASGLTIATGWRYNTHSPEQVGAAVKYVLHNNGVDFKNDLSKLEKKATEVADKIATLLKTI